MKRGNDIAHLPCGASLLCCFLVSVRDPLSLLSRGASRAPVAPLPAEIEEASHEVFRLRVFPKKGHVRPILRPSASVHKHPLVSRSCVYQRPRTPANLVWQNRGLPARDPTRSHKTILPVATAAQAGKPVLYCPSSQTVKMEGVGVTIYDDGQYTLLRRRGSLLRRVVTNLRNLRSVDQMDLALVVFNVEFTATRQ